MSLSPIGLPAEVKLGSLDYSLPPDAKSMNVKIQPSNVSQVQTTVTTPLLTLSSTAPGSCCELAFPVQNIVFDVPSSQSPSQFIDTRLSTLNFRMQLDVTGAASTAIPNAYLRSCAYSFFDRHYTVGPAGNILEDINEAGLVADTLINLQMSNSDRDGLGLLYGFSASTAIDNLGTALPVLAANTVNGSESHSFSVPLMNSLIGVTAEKFFNIGRCQKLQLVFQTSGVLPITLSNSGGTVLTTGLSFKVTLSDFSLQLEYIDIGLSALNMLDSTLVDGKAYNKGTTYRTSSAVLNAGVTGSQQLLAGIRGSSLKSLFTRFFQNKTTHTDGSVNGKYDSVNPCCNSICYNIGGARFPNVPVNPLLNPSQSFRELQMAIGNFNSTQFKSAITPNRYCVLASGGTATVGTTTPGTQAWEWQTNVTAYDKQALFFFGENLEIVAKRGVMSGMNATNAPIFVDLNIATAPTYSHNVYVTGMFDCVYIHDVKTGMIDVRM